MRMGKEEGPETCADACCGWCGWWIFGFFNKFSWIVDVGTDDGRFSWDEDEALRESDNLVDVVGLGSFCLESSFVRLEIGEWMVSRTDLFESRCSAWCICFVPDSSAGAVFGKNV